MLAFFHSLPESFLLFTLGMLHVFAAITVDRVRAQPTIQAEPELETSGLEAATG